MLTNLWERTQPRLAELNLSHSSRQRQEKTAHRNVQLTQTVRNDYLKSLSFRVVYYAATLWIYEMKHICHLNNNFNFSKKKKKKKDFQFTFHKQNLAPGMQQTYLKNNRKLKRWFRKVEKYMWDWVVSIKQIICFWSNKQNDKIWNKIKYIIKILKNKEKIQWCPHLDPRIIHILK